MMENYKVCTKCKKELPATEEYFYTRKNKSGIRELTCSCKGCQKTDSNRYYQKVKDNQAVKRHAKIYGLNRKEILAKQRQYKHDNKERLAEYQKEWYSQNKEYMKQYRQEHKEYLDAKNKEWQLKNKNRIKKYRRINKEKHKVYVRKWYKKRYDNDPTFAINARMSNAIWFALKNNKHGNHWEDLIGYTLDDLMKHLESLFLPGMTWDNRTEWHIDHIKPKSLFKYESYEDAEFKECWALSNLQPLWIEDNLFKNAKWNPNQENRNGDIQMSLIM